MEKSLVAVSVKLAYWEAYRLVVVLTATALRKFLYIFGIVYLLVIAVFISLLFRESFDQDHAEILGSIKSLIWASAIPLLCVFVAPLYSARRLLKDKRIKAGVRYEFSEAGIHTETSVSKSDLLWAAGVRVKELSSAFLVFTTSNSAYALPKRCFAGSHDVATLRELFRTHVANLKLRSERD